MPFAMLFWIRIALPVARSAAAARRAVGRKSSKNDGSCCRPGADVRDSRTGHAAGRGFTLVELLIAIAIIAVLATVTVSSYEHYRDKVEIAEAKSDIVAIANLIEFYRSDNGHYPNSLADIKMSGKLDPWNHPYQYLNLSPVPNGMNGKVRKDKNLVPINSDFDLYSMGADGASQPPLTAKVSRDDIVRANDGRYVGLVSDY